MLLTLIYITFVFTTLTNAEVHNQGRNPFEPSHDRMFDDVVKGTLSHRPLPIPPSVLTDEERDLENMLNLKEIRFMTDETTTTTEVSPKKIVESDEVKPRQIREIDNGTLSDDKQGGRPLILKSTDNEEETDTAPPEVVDPSILIKAEEDFLKQLSQAKC
uniref:Uncharacterized protein n=1 Tax=Ditylenchus dipsaci TaxID=166011 RepID=A0A915DR83_9BILA